MTTGIDSSVLDLMGPARNPEQTMIGAERQGEPVVEEIHTWNDLVMEVSHRPQSQADPSLSLRPGEQRVFERDGERIIQRLTPAGATVPGRSSPEVDLPFLGISSTAAFLGLVFGVVIATAPPPVEQTVVELPDRMRLLVLQAPPEPPPPPPAVAERSERAGEGKRAAGEEGARRKEMTQPKRKLDQEIAENAGVLGALADAGAMGGVFDAGLGDALSAGIGSLHASSGVAMGTGWGQLGRGPGGGGTEVGTIGGIGTRGRGGGGDGSCDDCGDMGPKKTGGLKTSGDPIIMGALDSSVIDGVVKRHLQSLRFCYQRELSRRPDMEGKVSMRFVIAADGSVSRANATKSSLGSPEVESCLSERFLRMTFPEPKGGGIVVVTYPFMFSAN